MAERSTRQDQRDLDALLGALEMRTPESRIELGLERVRTVLDRIAIDLDGRTVVSVAGTNGKGSTVAFIEAGLRAAGQRVLAYTSPHLLDFRERFRIDGAPAPAGEVLAALEAVELARGATPLTYFEQLTLAALVLAAGAGVDVLVLEVGLGGRLDAVNAVDADLAVITSIGLDHQDWLGRTRAKIALEKCGIARSGRPVIVAEPRPPAGMLDHLDERGCEVLVWGDAFDARWSVTSSGPQLNIRLGDRRIRGLRPGLAGRHQRTNATAAAQTLAGLGADEAAIRAGIDSARAAGRFQQVAEDPAVFVDVAHNAAAARALRTTLQARPGRKRAVFAALAGKDVEAIARALGPAIHHWYIAQLEGPRAVSARELLQRIRNSGVVGGSDAVELFANSAPNSVADALARARADCRGGDEVIVFGSFLTAAAACQALNTV